MQPASVPPERLKLEFALVNGCKGVLIATADRPFDFRARAAIAQLEGAAVLGTATSPSQLCNLCELLAPDLLLIDASGSGQDSAFAPTLSATARPVPPMLLFLDSTEHARFTVAAVTDGIRGFVAKSAPEADWVHAVRVVLDGDFWVRRSELALVFQAMLIPPPRISDKDSLTSRQQEIVACLTEGMSNKQIGRRLGISPSTVKTHMHNIFGRLGVSGRLLLLLGEGRISGKASVDPGPAREPAS